MRFHKAPWLFVLILALVSACNRPNVQTANGCLNNGYLYNNNEVVIESDADFIINGNMTVLPKHESCDSCIGLDYDDYISRVQLPSGKTVSVVSPASRTQMRQDFISEQFYRMTMVQNDTFNGVFPYTETTHLYADKLGDSIITGKFLYRSDTFVYRISLLNYEYQFQQRQAHTYVAINVTTLYENARHQASVFIIGSNGDTTFVSSTDIHASYQLGWSQHPSYHQVDTSMCLEKERMQVLMLGNATINLSVYGRPGVAFRSNAYGWLRP